MKLELNIYFTDRKRISRWGTLGYDGTIVIGEFQEGFFAPVCSWSIRDYERQWQNALELLKTNKYSSLITAAYLPPKGAQVIWWSMQKKGSKLYIHNSFFWGPYYKRRFRNRLLTPQNFNIFHRYSKLNEKRKRQISEWCIDLPLEYQTINPKIRKRQAIWAL